MLRSSGDFPANPIVLRLSRGDVVESVHRGAWCLVDPRGTVLASAGDVEHAYFARSAVKSVQVLPLLESGAAARYELGDEELALAMASHGGEDCHTEIVRRTLARLGLEPRHLRCGVHAPFDARARAELQARDESPSALHNNCSGKHAGFLALAQHLGDPLESYLDPASRAQARVRAALAELSDVPERALVPALDGCSAPTYRLPLRGLATAFARLSNPDGLPRERAAFAARLVAIAGAHPVLIGGSRQFLDTDLLRASGGRLFPKIGAEAVHALGVVGGGRALAVKIDDGGARALSALVLALVEALGLATSEELAPLATWRQTTLTNAAGLEVGRVEAVLPVAVRA